MTNPAAILTDLAQLMMDLAQTSNEKHGKAIQMGLETPDGRGTDGQSHAYAMAALDIQKIIDRYSA